MDDSEGGDDAEPHGDLLKGRRPFTADSLTHRSQIAVRRGAREDAEPGANDPLPDLHLGAAAHVVVDAEGDDRGEPEEEGDAEAVRAHRL